MRANGIMGGLKRFIAKWARTFDTRGDRGMSWACGHHVFAQCAGLSHAFQHKDDRAVNAERLSSARIRVTKAAACNFVLNGLG